jgi:hypothetical protein
MKTMMWQAHEDDKGREVFVSRGLGKASDPWGAFRIKKEYAGGLCCIERIISNFLPLCATRDLAQWYLDMYAERKGWEKIPTCVRCGCTEKRGCSEGCFWIEDNLCSQCEGRIGRATSALGAMGGTAGRGEIPPVRPHKRSDAELNVFTHGSHRLTRTRTQ